MAVGSHRRRFLLAGGALACVAVATRLSWRAAADGRGHFPVSHSDAEWLRMLGARRYGVLRAGGTERPFSSPLLHERGEGQFVCAGCAKPLFSSQTKFDSGTGWPSFWAPLADATLTRRDDSFAMRRMEVLCSACGGHLGHVFHDGPAPTGLRYCMNGLALDFRGASANNHVSGDHQV
jgi:peptide-methionine (R)-S-oxide reductase